VKGKNELRLLMK